MSYYFCYRWYYHYQYFQGYDYHVQFLPFSTLSEAGTKVGRVDVRAGTALSSLWCDDRVGGILVFFWLALRTLTFWGLYMNYNTVGQKFSLKEGFRSQPKLGVSSLGVSSPSNTQNP